MVNLPDHGSTVHIWPTNPRVQDGPLAVSDGGRFLPMSGRDVVWGEFHYRQLLGGEIRLHEDKPAVAKPAYAREGK